MSGLKARSYAGGALKGFTVDGGRLAKPRSFVRSDLVEACRLAERSCL